MTTGETSLKEFTPKPHTPGRQVQVHSKLLQGGQPNQTRKEGALLVKMKTEISRDEEKATGSVPAP